MKAASLLSGLITQLIGGELPVGLRAWDGSTADQDSGPKVVLRSGRALRRLLWNPGELRNLSGATVRLQDYRDLDGEPFDAIASLEMGEHVGDGSCPAYAATLFRVLRPEGKLPLQQMSRGAVAPGGGAFIESYIAPDMTMVPVGETVTRLEAAGFEVRGVEAMREHYVWTVRAWAEELERHREEVIAVAGEGQLRVWRLYLAGGALAFEENRMGVNQILAVRTTVDSRSGLAA